MKIVSLRIYYNKTNLAYKQLHNYPYTKANMKSQHTIHGKAKREHMKYIQKASSKCEWNDDNRLNLSSFPLVGEVS